MIEINCNVWYKIIKMLSGITREYRFQFRGVGFRAAAVDRKNVIMQEIIVDERVLVSYTQDIKPDEEIGVDVSQLLPFAKAHKSDGFMKLTFEDSLVDGVYNGKIVTDAGATFEFKTIPVKEVRKSPLTPTFDSRDCSEFVITKKELASVFKEIGCSVKNDGVYIMTNTTNNAVEFLCRETRCKSSLKLPGILRDNKCLFTYDLIKTICNISDSKDRLKVVLITDKPIQIYNMSEDFTNEFLCAPGIESKP